MAEINKRKSDKLYAAIDNSGFYNNPVEKEMPLMDEYTLHPGKAGS